MIKLNKIKYFVFIVVLFTLVSPVFVLAQTPEEEQQIDLLYGEQNNNLPSSNPFNQIIPYQPTVSQNSPTRTSCYDTIDDIGDVICRIGSLLNAIVPVLVALGVVYFVWGVVQYVVGDNEEAKKKGRDRVIFGIIGLALIVGLWGIVSLVINTFDIGQNISVVNPSSAVILDTDPAFCSLGNSPKFQDLLGYGTCIISSSVIPLLFMLALASFIWGVIQFVILGSGEEAKKEQGRQFMLWGIIALAVMVSVWGLVRIAGDTFGIDYAIPQVKSR